MIYLYPRCALPFLTASGVRPSSTLLHPAMGGADCDCDSRSRSLDQFEAQASRLTLAPGTGNATDSKTLGGAAWHA